MFDGLDDVTGDVNKPVTIPTKGSKPKGGSL